MQLEERRRLCDPVTKFNFRWSHVAEGVTILLLIALVWGYIDVRDFIKWSQEYHAKIPAGFHAGERWDFASEMREQAETNKRLGVMNERMSLIESEHRHMVNMVERIEEAVQK